MGVKTQVALTGTGFAALVVGLALAWLPLGLIVGGGLLLAIGLFSDLGGRG